MTYLQLINKVMDRLREEEVSSSNASAYSQLVGDFVSDIMEEVQEPHDWSSLYYVNRVPLQADVFSYDLRSIVLSGGDLANVDVGNEPTDRSEISIGRNTRPNVWLFTDGDTSPGEEGAQMTVVSTQTIQSLYNKDRANTNDRPTHVSFNAHSLGPLTGNLDSGLQMKVWPPTDNATRDIRVEFYTPQTGLEPDGNSDDVAIRIPWRPIYLGALMLAFNERGEEMGEPGGLLEKRYFASLGSAIEADSKIRQLTNRYQFYRD